MMFSSGELEIAADVRKVFVVATVVYGGGLTLAFAVMALADNGWDTGAVPWGLLVAPVVGGFVFAGIMARSASRQRFTLGPAGVTLHARKGTVTIPAEVLRGAGVVRWGFRRFLVVRFESSVVVDDLRLLEPFVRMGRRVTKSAGSVAVQVDFMRPGAAEIQARVEADGLGG